MPTATRKIKCDKPLTRSFSLKREAVNEEDRTVELTFSSETTDVERWFGVEILDHSPKAMRTERINNNGPLLFNHDWDAHLGAVQDVRIEQMRGKAVVRFGNSPLAEEKFRDVMDGILTAVSFAYRVHRLVLEQEVDDGPNVYRATDWEPLEISLVTVPADISVGVGRAAGESFEIEVEETTMDPKDKKGGADNTRDAGTNNQQPVDRDAITNEVRQAEQKRVADLLAMGKRYAQYGARELAEEYIASGKKPEDLQRAILDRLPTEDKAATPGDAPASDIELTAREVEQYSLLRAINAAVNGDWSKAGFELECSRAIEERAGRDARGFFVPVRVQTRVMNATSGADLIGTDHLAGEFIDTLKPNSIVMTLGATVLDGLVGNVTIPKKTGDSTFYWLGDDDDVTDSDASIGSVGLSPKTVAGSVPMSRRLLKQSSPSIEALIQADLQRGAGLAIDLAALEGSGAANQPQGIVNVTGVNTQTVSTAGTPTHAELVGFETKVADDNALDGSLAYVTTSAVRGKLKVTAKDSGSGLFLMEKGEANGYPVAVRNGITTHRIIFGNWNDVLIGLWGILDVMPDTSTKAAAGGLVLRVFQDVDVAVRHAESFCKNA